jgi:lipid A 3-O-deacylase
LPKTKSSDKNNHLLEGKPIMLHSVPLLTAVLMAAGIGGGSFVDAPTPVVHRDYLSGAVGWFDLVDNNEQDEAIDLRAEFTSRRALYSAGIVSIYPFVGVEGTTDGSIYGLGGVKAEIKYDSVYVTPSFGVGLYSSGEGKAMGSPLEFRTGFEVGYEFNKVGERIGVSFTHISNAEVAENNPGAEQLSLYYHYPINW